MNMSVKYLILVAICVACVQSDNDDRVLNKRISKMKSKLFDGKVTAENTFLTVVLLYRVFAPDGYRNGEDVKAMEAFKVRVINQTEQHYADIEEEARVTGVLKYTQPNLYIMHLADEGRDNFVEPVKRAILDSDKFENETKTKCVDLWMEATEVYLDFYRGLAKIEEANPEEFFIIEDTKGWRGINTPMPADSSPEILNVSKQIKATIDRLEVWMNALDGRLKQSNIGHLSRSLSGV